MGVWFGVFANTIIRGREREIAASVVWWDINSLFNEYFYMLSIFVIYYINQFAFCITRAQYLA